MVPVKPPFRQQAAPSSLGAVASRLPVATAGISSPGALPSGSPDGAQFGALEPASATVIHP